MADGPDTHASLLVRIRDPRDGAAWGLFAELYTPLIAGFARRRGLQPADADDLTQAVLAAVSGSIRGLEYDPAKGTFRSWLFRVVRRALARFHARAGHAVTGSGDSAVQALLDAHPDGDATAEAEWEQEYRRQRFRWAAGRVEPNVAPANWQAFWRTAVGGEPAAAVAAELGMTVGAVYTAKCRVLDRIRAELDALGDE